MLLAYAYCTLEPSECLDDLGQPCSTVLGLSNGTPREDCQKRWFWPFITQLATTTAKISRLGRSKGAHPASTVDRGRVTTLLSAVVIFGKHVMELFLSVTLYAPKYEGIRLDADI